MILFSLMALMTIAAFGRKHVENATVVADTIFYAENMSNVTIKMLNRMNDLLQPKRIYPIHIDDYSHYKTTKNEVETAGYRVLAVGETIDI